MRGEKTRGGKETEEKVRSIEERGREMWILDMLDCIQAIVMKQNHLILVVDEFKVMTINILKKLCTGYLKFEFFRDNKSQSHLQMINLLSNDPEIVLEFKKTLSKYGWLSSTDLDEHLTMKFLHEFVQIITKVFLARYLRDNFLKNVTDEDTFRRNVKTANLQQILDSATQNF